MLVVFALATAGVYFGVVYRPVSQRLGDIKEAEIRLLHRVLRDRVGRTLDLAGTELKSLAALESVRGFARKDLDQALVQADRTTAIFEKFSALDVAGRIVSRPSMVDAIGVDRSDRGYFVGPMKSRGLFVDDVRQIAGGLSLSLGVPVIGMDGEMRGVLAGHMDLSAKSPSLCRTNERWARRVPHESFLASPTGYKIGQSTGSFAVSDLSDIDVRDHPMLRNPPADTESRVFRAGGRDWFGLVSTIAPANWLLVTLVDRSATEEAAFAVIDDVGWLVVLSFLALLAVSVYFGARVVRPIRKLTMSLAEYGASGVVPELTDSVGGGEVSQAARAFNRMVSERGDVEAELMKQRGALRDLAAELSRVEQSTRREIAGELHDHISQDLAAAKIRLELVQDRLEHGDGGENLGVAMELIHGCILSTSRLTNRLAQPAIEQLGFVRAVESLVAGYRAQHKMDCRFESDAQGIELDAERLDVLYRGVSELLHNIEKHAEASIVRVRVLETGGDLLVEVGDDGCGFTPGDEKPRLGQLGGYGLFGLSERIRHLGGDVRIDSAPGQGCLVSLRIPSRASKVEASRAVSQDSTVSHQGDSRRPATGTRTERKVRK